MGRSLCYFGKSSGVLTKNIDKKNIEFSSKHEFKLGVQVGIDKLNTNLGSRSSSGVLDFITMS